MCIFVLHGILPENQQELNRLHSETYSNSKDNLGLFTILIFVSFLVLTTMPYNEVYKINCYKLTFE